MDEMPVRGLFESPDEFQARWDAYMATVTEGLRASSARLQETTRMLEQVNQEVIAKGAEARRLSEENTRRWEALLARLDRGRGGGARPMSTYAPGRLRRCWTWPFSPSPERGGPHSADLAGAHREPPCARRREPVGTSLLLAGVSARGTPVLAPQPVPSSRGDAPRAGRSARLPSDLSPCPRGVPPIP
jgi:hypothetical protein